MLILTGSAKETVAISSPSPAQPSTPNSPNYALDHPEDALLLEEEVVIANLISDLIPANLTILMSTMIVITLLLLDMPSFPAFNLSEELLIASASKVLCQAAAQALNLPIASSITALALAPVLNSRLPLVPRL